MKIELILLGVIGLVFLIDFIMNSRKKPSIDNVVDQIENNEPFKQNSKFSYQFSLYKKINIVLLVLFLGLCFTPGKIIEYNENRIKKSFSDYELLANGHFIYQGIEYAFFFDNEFIDKKAIDKYKRDATSYQRTLFDQVMYEESDLYWKGNKYSNYRLKQEAIKKGYTYQEYLANIPKITTENLVPMIEKYNSIVNGTYSSQNYAYSLNSIINHAVSKYRLTAKDFFEKFPRFKMLPASELKEVYKYLLENINNSEDSKLCDFGPETYFLTLSKQKKPFLINHCSEGPLAYNLMEFDSNLFNYIFPDTSKKGSEVKNDNHIKFYLILSLVFLFLFLINQFFYDRLKYLTARKKNISLLLIIIPFLKVLTHYLFSPIMLRGAQTGRSENVPGRFDIDLGYKSYEYFYDNPYKDTFGNHLDLIFISELWLFIPVIFFMIFIAWFFNDKIKAR